MVNHGNTTIFLDGWTNAFFAQSQTGSGFALYIVAPCSTTISAHAGGVAAYPGGSTNINDFQYARPGLPAGCSAAIPSAVLDISTCNQDTGGAPSIALADATSAST